MSKFVDLEKIKPIDFPSTEMDGLDVVRYLNTLPTVDAVPVDEIRVDIHRICIENQEVILSVSICGKPNEVKIPFSKDVAEVVHGRWKPELMPTGVEYTGWAEMTVQALSCSECGILIDVGEGYFAHCPNCGAKMDGDENG